MFWVFPFVLVVYRYFKVEVHLKSLQRELFSPGEEKLVSLVHVTGVVKKKEALPCFFLLVAVTSDQTIGAVIYKVAFTIVIEGTPL